MAKEKPEREPATDEKSSGQTDTSGSNNSEASVLSIVAIGASAGGFEAFGQLVEGLSSGTGATFVFIQHLAPGHESSLPSLLGKRSKLPIVEAKDGMEVQPDHIYVMPPGSEMTIEAKTLKLSPRPPHDSLPPAGHFAPIDKFFASLAGQQDTIRPIGVILSGTGTDGSVGLREIKNVDGITIVQNPDSAKYDGMPRSAINTGMVDLILEPRKIGEEIATIIRHPYVQKGHDEKAEEATPFSEDQLREIFELLRQASGVDFTYYKRPTIYRRLQRRMALHKIERVDDYIAFLKENHDEGERLHDDLLIHVTNFFREPESFEVLRNLVFPQIIEDRNRENPIRIWVPGCSPGEEAFSVAIRLIDFLQERNVSFPVQIFATDVSESAIQQARMGVFSDHIKTDVSEDELRRFFTRMDGTYRIAKSIRDMVVFARQDLTRDPPFSRLDLILCRNVLIYMEHSLQKKLLSVFHYALKARGYLLLGSSETINAHPELFQSEDKKYRLFSRKNVEIPPQVSFPSPFQ